MNKPRRPATFSDIYQRHIRAGDDPAYALYAAEEWERRRKRKEAPPVDAPMQNPNPPAVCASCEDLKAALRYLAMAWDGLCDCVDEFEPGDLAACAEHRDALDSAILRAIKLVEPYRA